MAHARATLPHGSTSPPLCNNIDLTLSGHVVHILYVNPFTTTCSYMNHERVA
jgi:hypothetical protein